MNKTTSELISIIAGHQLKALDSGYDPYYIGMYNGFETVLATLEDCAPNFMDVTPPDYKERLVIELRQLQDKCNKLENMLIKYASGTLDFTPSCPLELLKEQLTHMWHYLHILKVRAEIEGITGV